MHWQLGQTVGGIAALQTWKSRLSLQPGQAGLARVPAPPPLPHYLSPIQDMTAWPGVRGSQQFRQGGHSRSHPQPGSHAARPGACSRASSLSHSFRGRGCQARRIPDRQGRVGGRTGQPGGSSGPRGIGREGRGVRRPRVDLGQGPCVSQPSPGRPVKASGSMRRIPFRSLASFGEGHRGYKGAPALVSEGQTKKREVPQVEGASRAKAEPCEVLRGFEQP